MNRENLIKLRELLLVDAYNPRGLRFDLGSLGETSLPTGVFGRFKRVLGVEPPAPSVSCGTSGCAMGLAALSGAFPELSYTVLTSTKAHKSIYLTMDGCDINFGTAAMALFDITYSQAMSLFDPGYYPSRLREGRDAELEVAKRIDVLLSESVSGPAAGSRSAGG